MASRFFAVIGVFFMVLGALNLIAGVVMTKLGTVLAPGLFCAGFGVVCGLYPVRVTVTIDRTAGELTRTSRSLFSRSTVTERLSELTAVGLQAGAYYWYFDATRRDGSRVRLFQQMKRGWTWAAPTPEVLARAREIAEALALPLEPPR